MEVDQYVKISHSIPLGELCILQNEDHISYVLETDNFAAKALEFLK